MAHLVDMGGSIPRDNSMGSIPSGKSPCESTGGFNLSRENFRKTLKMDKPMNVAGQLNAATTGVKIEKTNANVDGCQMDQDVSAAASMIYLENRVWTNFFPVKKQKLMHLSDGSVIQLYKF